MNPYTPLARTILLATGISLSTLSHAVTIMAGDIRVDTPRVPSIESPAVNPPALQPQASNPLIRIDHEASINHCKKLGHNPETSDSSIVFEDVQFARGSHSRLIPLRLEQNGFYKAKLTDLEFPDPFKTLSLAITSSAMKYGELAEPGELTFEALAGKIFMGLFFDAACHTPGMYGLRLEYLGASDPAPVPLPGAAWLFGSGLFGLGLLSRRKSS